ncbi:MAG: hypothetical protein HY812_12865 [Planctomycetes bacterium]|nr:hypothetical protein [Planctomycetota bacterium]
MREPVVISAAVEGLLDEAVVRRLIEHAGGALGAVHGRCGKPALRNRAGGYNNAARHAPWIVLVDLNGDEDCAPSLRDAWLPDLAPHLCFRVAVRAVEAWLIADSERLARFLGIAGTRVPREPERLEDPKRSLVDLARTSRRREIRRDMVPREGSGRASGPAYSSRVIEFVTAAWRPEVAADRSESLRRAIACVERLIQSA